jgi:hypothetical protein
MAEMKQTSQASGSSTDSRVLNHTTCNLGFELSHPQLSENDGGKM